MSASANSLLISATLHAVLIVPLAVAALSGDGAHESELHKTFQVSIKRLDEAQPKQITQNVQELAASSDDDMDLAGPEKVVETVSPSQPVRQPDAARSTRKEQVVARSDPTQQTTVQRPVSADSVQQPLKSVSPKSLHDKDAGDVVQSLATNDAVADQEPAPTEAMSRSNIVEASIDHERIAEAYRSLLLEAIAAKKNYPMRARRQGFEGEVVIGFTVNGDGKISDVDVVQSSHHRPLDLAAVNTVKQVDRVDPIPALLGKNEWQFQVPLKYALN